MYTFKNVGDSEHTNRPRNVILLLTTEPVTKRFVS